MMVDCHLIADRLAISKAHVFVGLGAAHEMINRAGASGRARRQQLLGTGAMDVGHVHSLLLIVNLILLRIVKQRPPAKDRHSSTMLEAFSTRTERRLPIAGLPTLSATAWLGGHVIRGFPKGFPLWLWMPELLQLLRSNGRGILHRPHPVLIAHFDNLWHALRPCKGHHFVLKDVLCGMADASRTEVSHRCAKIGPPSACTRPATTHVKFATIQRVNGIQMTIQRGVDHGHERVPLLWIIVIFVHHRDGAA